MINRPTGDKWRRRADYVEVVEGDDVVELEDDVDESEELDDAFWDVLVSVFLPVEARESVR